MHHHLHGVLGAAAGLASSLPRFGEPDVIPLAGVLGGFIAAGISFMRGDRPEEARVAAFEGSFAGTGLGAATYLFGIISGLILNPR